MSSPTQVLALCATLAVAACGGPTKPPSPASDPEAALAPAPAVVADVVAGAPAVVADVVAGAPAVVADVVAAVAPHARPDVAAPAVSDDASQPPAASAPSWWPDTPLPGAWLPTRRGYLNRWAVTGPTTARRFRSAGRPAQLTAALNGGPSAVLAAPAPIVEVAPHERLKKTAPMPGWRLQGRVHVPVATDAWLQLGVTGRATVWLNDQQVFDETSDQYLLPDHRRVRVRLDAGWSDLTARLIKVNPYAVRFTARLRGLDGGPLPQAQWALPDGVQDLAGPCQGLALTTLQRASGPDPVVQVSVDAPGLLPAAWAGDLLTRLGPPAGDSPQRADVSSRGAALASEAVTIALPLARR